MALKNVPDYLRLFLTEAATYSMPMATPKAIKNYCKRRTVPFLGAILRKIKK